MPKWDDVDLELNTKLIGEFREKWFGVNTEGWLSGKAPVSKTEAPVTRAGVRFPLLPPTTERK